MPRSHVALVVCALLVVPCALDVSLAAYPFSDDAESGVSRWSLEPPWAVTGTSFHGGSHSFTDSPGTNYANAVNVSMTQAAPMDLTGAARPRLAFWHRHALETDFDFGYVEISLDGGATWQPQPLARFTGNRDWTRTQLDLSPWIGQAAVKVRFRLVSDVNIARDGWYIDDVLAGEGPQPETLAAPTAATANTLTLSWSQSAEPDFASYRLVRGNGPNFDWTTGTTVATITSRTTLTVQDTGLAPKSTYFYRLVVARTNGLESPSNEVSGTTTPGMDYPFLDNGEGGAATWTADYPWALSTEAAHGGAWAWSDSPGGNYGDNLAGISLTLSTPVDLAAATRPVLSFWHTCHFPGNDHGLVEVSTDGGSTWTALRDFTNTSVPAWRHEQVDLSAYRRAGVLLRFRITSDGWTNGDGWHLDDISVSEQLSPVAAPVLSAVGTHSITLGWTPNTDLDFSHYALVRATPTGTSINAPVIATIADQATGSFTDSGLLIGTNYSYRVYAINGHGAYSADSPTESTATTSALALPFADDFESGGADWNLSGAWSVATLTAHGGAACLQDSPGNYPDNYDASAMTQLDLSTATWPVLSFWDRCDFQPNADVGHVDVSPDGTSWTGVYAAAGLSAGWQRHEVDLSPWKGDDRVWLRLRTNSDGAVSADGWLIDDLEIADRAAAPRALPFYEGFEAGAADWIPGVWSIRSDDPRQGAAYLRDFASTLAPWGGWYATHLLGTFDLSATTSPQLTFWMRGDTGYDRALRVQLSTDGGRGWIEPWVSGVNAPAWTRVQIPLSSYRAPAVRIRFVSYSGCCWAGSGVGLDDIALEEAPAAPVMGVPAPHLKSMDLAWSAPAIGNFLRYEVYRRDSAGVDLNATRIAVITDHGTTSHTDTGLSIGKTYYYRVYVVSSGEVYNASNEVSATTTPLLLPMVDPMESDANWVAEGTNGTWGIAGDAPHGGSGYFSDSPFGAYQNSMDATLTTAVNLSTANWPVLTFWDRFDYQVNADAGRVEVSTNSGGSWTGVYAAVGTRETWMERRVDLSPFKGYNSVIVRFRAVSDGATTADGWRVDDVTIADVAPPARTLPFAEGFEAGAGNWFGGAWELLAEGHQGAQGLVDFPRTAIPYGGWYAAHLAGEFDLSGTTSPQFVFWARGATGYDQALRLQYSIDGGRSWPDLWATGINYPTWTRVQISLESLRRAGVRFRFVTYAGCCWAGEKVKLDDVAVEEGPSAPTMSVPVPHLKSMDLSWSAPSSANFKQYEVYRRTSAGVDLNATRIAVIDDPAVTSVTDTGLSIGKPYYYRVYLVTTSDVYTPSNEVSATTTALALPVVDPMESDANWVSEGTNGAWAVSGTDPHGGSSCFSDSAGAYQNGMDISLTTAVNLSAAAWPVLTFWDRYEYQANADSGHVDISINGGASWTGVYAVSGAGTVWTRRQIDLSPWKGYASVVIRFRSNSDGGTVADGWSLDDVAIEDHAIPPGTLPFADGFEAGDTGWLGGNWEVLTGDGHGGSAHLRDFSRSLIPWGGWYATALFRQFDLSSSASPQLVYWLKGRTGYDQNFRAQVSTDGGRGWTDLWVAGVNLAGWTRYQLSLANYRAPSVRLRFVTYAGCCWDATGVLLDDVAVEEALAKPVIQAPDNITTNSMRIRWSRSNEPNFDRYVVYRSETSPVSESSAVLAVITDADVTELVDAGLGSRSRYYYRVFAYSDRDAGTGSDEIYGVTLGATLPYTDAFETDSGLWTRSGDWGRVAGIGREESWALADSPGVYGNSADTFARIGLDLHELAWPALTFWEKRNYQTDADWGRVEVSPDFGASWHGVATFGGVSTDWTFHRVDLSAWRNQAYVWVRFRLISDGATALDGWTIDDLRIGESDAAPASYPFFDGFEDGNDRWLAGQWTVSNAAAYEGARSVDNSFGSSNPWSGWYVLALGSALDLSAAQAPTWTFLVRGRAGYDQSLRAQVSTDGGLGWADLWAAGFNYTTWTKIQVPLDGYKRAGVRFRFVYTGGCCVDAESIFLDNVGIGGPEPGPPAAHSPAEGETVSEVRPTLVIDNAFDPQSDPLTYNFEVYADPGLTNLVAQVPSVAEGEPRTTWAIDTDLADNHGYWWRCRASDGAAQGPWMAPASFVVTTANSAPTVPEIVGPANGTQLWGPDSTLTWYPSSDANPGDSITYDLAIDDDGAFGSPEIDETGIAPPSGPMLAPAETITVTLGDLAGFENLQSGHMYYWRLRALDQRGATAGWTPEVRYFHYGFDGEPPQVAWGAPAEDTVVTTSPVLFAGTAQDSGGGLDYVQVSTDGGQTWHLASGGGSWSYSFSPAQNGPLTALVRAADRAGNISVPLPRHLTIALPDIPDLLVAVPDNSVITLAWTAPQLCGFSGFALYSSSTSGSGFTKLADIPAGTLRYRHTGLTSGTAVYYVVRAVYPAGEGGSSPEAFARVIVSGRPPFVDDLVVTRSGNDLRLDWSPVTTDPGTGPESCAGYWVFDGAEPTFDPAHAAGQRYVAGATTTTFVGHAADGQRHHYHVVAADSAGKEGFWTQWFAEDDDPRVAAGAGWADVPAAQASGGSYLGASAAGSVATLAFSGSQVRLSLARGPARGIAQLRLDGVPAGTIDLYAPTDEWGGWLYVSPVLADGPHELEIVATGTGNPASGGTEIAFDRWLFGRLTASQWAARPPRLDVPRPAGISRPKRR
ncbi:MAG: immune inhibitor A [Acidobacteria bacterium]|nr:immune inhibitor A [Acidobacteriota bacterium]